MPKVKMQTCFVIPPKLKNQNTPSEKSRLAMPAIDHNFTDFYMVK